MKGSPFISNIEDGVKDWEKLLLYTLQMLDEWLKFQRTWIYLEPIFSSEDIVTQLPKESKKFATVDLTYRKIMTTVKVEI